MPIERLAYAVFAAAIICGVITVGGIAMPGLWDKAVHFTVFSLLTVCLWRATEMPLLALGAALLLGGLDEWRQAYIPGRVSDAQDFIADACAVLTAGTLLFMQRKSVCAESSPR